MVEVFDARGVSFVAVTQQFNTTTSMGTPDAQRPAVLRPVRARGDRRTDPGQDRRLEVNQLEAQKDSWKSSAVTGNSGPFGS